MKLTDFVIGETFWTHGGECRCTDVGTRIVVAVKLGPREIARAANADGELPIMKRIDDDGSWLNGRRTPSRNLCSTRTTCRDALEPKLNCWKMARTIELTDLHSRALSYFHGWLR